LAVTLPGLAAQIDIAGPAGSAKFGASVAVLPNGNFVVTDPAFSTSSVGDGAGIGAVYLYRGDGTLVSTLTGSHSRDGVGSGGVLVLSNSNFVVVSPGWFTGHLGAVTWINGSTGLSGVVSESNSLVGQTLGDNIGSGGVTALTNGNFVVASPLWSNGTTNYVGAVTWGSGEAGLSGVVSSSNSLVGSSYDDSVGTVTPLCNGNYVVATSGWKSGLGAVTWGDGNSGIRGPISSGNSLIGSTIGDDIGNAGSLLAGVVVLSNCNYVVASPYWSNGSTTNVGAVTWANGSSGISGVVSNANSLIGATAGDLIGLDGVTPLTNGNYVVASQDWSDGATLRVGAITWGNGDNGTVGVVSAENSLVGTSQNDFVGDGEVTPLSDGNYVVASGQWTNGTGAPVCAVTWVDGGASISGIISSANSFISGIGASSVPLENGNYVVSSPNWNNGAATRAGAATLASDTSSLIGQPSAGNSLVGASIGDSVGGYVVPLANGNYVVVSNQWSNGATLHVGAVTWVDSNIGMTGVVSPVSSLVGTVADHDQSGFLVTALRNGNYVISQWSMGASSPAAVVWANGNRGLSGTISPSNSFAFAPASGPTGPIVALGDGNYIVLSPAWNNGAAAAAGAVSLLNGRFRTVGTIQPWNSVIGNAANGGASMVYAYDSSRHQLIVGRPVDNVVSLFTMDQIFADGLDP
jgi:hypothetical protein